MATIQKKTKHKKTHTQKITSVDKDVKKLEPLFNVGVGVNVK